MKSPITILVSEEPYLIGNELEEIEKKVLETGLADFNCDRFSGKSDSAEVILNACYTLPMMAPSRLVIVREAEGLAAKDDLERWIAYFENPSPTTELVLIASKVDKRVKLWQTANKKGMLRELKVPYANQLPAWLMQQASNKKIKISSEAASWIAACCGENLMALSTTLDQLAVFVAPREEITLVDAQKGGGALMARNVFEFTEKVGEKKLGEAVSHLHQLITGGEPPVRLLFMLARHFRLLLLAKEGLGEKIGESEMAGRLGVHPFFVKDYLRQAQKLTIEALKETYRNLLAADRAAKSSPLNPSLILDRFLMGACLG